jgi:hypothetical protein
LILLWKAFVLSLGGSFVTVEVSMIDLHETSDPKYKAQIDTVGWIFVAFVLVITAVASMVAFYGSDTTIVNTAVSHAVGSPS